MKAGWLLAAIFASIVAGAGGGYVAVQYATPAQNTPKQVAAADPLSLEGDANDKGTDNSDELTKLRQDIQALQVRLDQAERDKKDLKEGIDSLNTKLAKAASAAPVTSGGETVDNGGSTDPVDTTNPAFAEAVEKVIQQREEEAAAKRDAERKKQMEDWAASRNKAIVDKLATELSLTEVQKVNIETVLTDMNTKRGEVMERGRAARDAGEEFDWQAEMKTVSDEALEAVKGELSSAQVSTLNTLLGDSGSLDSLAGRGGFGGFGGGGRNSGGGRGGRGGGNGG
ncbi:MAG: hypothetical protein H6839_15745 [Planctomycetes bacterium]|nr:hypothetical protein [Planctomycetota bacterium]